MKHLRDYNVLGNDISFGSLDGFVDFLSNTLLR